MEKKLPKIGGVTIERVPKVSQATPQKQKIPAGISLPPGISIQSFQKPQLSHPQYQQNDDNDYDDFDEEGEEWMGGTEMGGNAKSPVLLSSEDDVGEHQKQYSDETASSESGEFLSPLKAPAKALPTAPVLPPGVTFQRKKTIPPATATIRPSVQLPPGVSFAKKSTKTNVPGFMAPASVIPPARTPPPVRAVRPRAKLEPPRMMINDFLEQRMQIEPSLLGLPRVGEKPSSVNSFRQTALPKNTKNIAGPSQRTPSKPLALSPKRPNPQVSPFGLTSPKTSSRVSEYDSEDDLPLCPKKTESAAIRLPPGISFERNKTEKAMPSPKTPPVSKEKPRPQPQIQLPPGISLERKASAPPVMDYDHEEEDDYEDDPEDNIQLKNPPKITEVIAPIEEKKKLPSGFQLPPGISLGKQFAGAPKIDSGKTEQVNAEPSNRQNKFSNSNNALEFPVPSKVSETPLENEQEDDKADDYEYEEEAYDENAMDQEDQEYPLDHDDQDYEDKLDQENQDYEAQLDHDDQNYDHPLDPGEQDYEDQIDQENQDYEAQLDHENYDHPLEEDQEFENEHENVAQQDPSHMEEKHNDYSEGHDEEYNEDMEEETGVQNNPENSDIVDQEKSSDGVVEGAEESGLGVNSTEGEIDFETLLAAPMIPTINSLSQADEATTDQEKEQMEEKENLQNFMDMMTKGELEGELDEEEEDDKKAEKRKGDEEQDEGETSAKKIKSEDDEEEPDESIDTSKVSSSHLRKNIREVMDETKLDEATLAAQRLEAERLKRLQEQQRIVREVKRQIQMSRSAERTQNQSHVLSLLRGNSETSILKKSAVLPTASTVASTSKEQDSILLKMGNGQQTCLSDKMREILRTPGKSSMPETSARSMLSKGMLSSSVTIAPIKKEPTEDKKRGDVVTLSSDSDDCVVLSEEEHESEPEDDPTNSGLHTSDRYNVPDEQGRVLVNVGHPPGETDVFLAPQIARIIKPHQIGGVRFLFDNIIETVDRYESSPGFGCILAHSMGLGKTLQIVSFSDIFLRHTSGKKILCIMPINTIQNWQAEFNMWVPKINPNGGDVRCRNFDIYVVNESSKNMQTRGKVILEWHKNGGVLLMGYELFRLLSLKRPIRSKKKRPDQVEAEKNRDLVEDIYAALIKPGPDLVICDEGHRIKNSHASTSQALKLIRTKRRIVLTGYPLQNNLLEYWCMVDFVRPNYLGSKTEFSNMFERPIQNGQCIDSTPQDKRLMRYRAHVLHSLLEGFVQRRSHEVLQQVLPMKQEYVLLLRFTPFQSQLYKTFMDEVVRTVAVPNPLRAFAVCCKIWNHPDVLHNFLKIKGEQRDLDLEEALAPPVGLPPFMGEMGGMPYGQSIPAPPPAVAPWPKRGPGSRGGKVRQRKGTNRGPTPTVQKEEQQLPSMDQFSVQNTGFSGAVPSTGYPTSSSYSQYPQDNRYGNQYEENKPFKGQYGYSDPSYPDGSNSNYNYNRPNDPNGEFNQVPYDSGFSSNSGFTGDFQQPNMWGNSWGGSSQGGYSSGSEEFMSPPKFPMEDKKEELGGGFPLATGPVDDKRRVPAAPFKAEVEDKKEEKDGRKDEISYDWAVELFKNYVAGIVENSSKMEVFMLILHESIARGDRILVFSQSLLTLDLIEDLLQKRVVPGRSEHWAKNRNYFRLDGSTPALEREKLINEFNSNEHVIMFLVSTRAGSLGINLVGANRVVVFDASWNPCHDTQAVCRVYRYGQKKPCYVYRLVMDSCLEKKIYDRQVNKQGMADRIVDELNPDAHLSLKDVTNLCWDDQEETTVTDFSDLQHKYHDEIVKLLLSKHSGLLSRAPFQHESLLIDRKEKKLSQAEKRLAKRSYELEKQAAANPRGMHHLLPGGGSRGFSKPIASVKPMQSGVYGGYGGMPPRSKWIPAEVWQKQGMSAQEMTLPLDVVIPTNSPDKTSIVLKAGQRVMVLKSPKGIYMQLETGKIIAIRTAFKVGAGAGAGTSGAGTSTDKSDAPNTIASALKNNPNVTITKNSPQRSPKPTFLKPSSLDKQAAAINMAATKGRVISNKGRPNLSGVVKKPGITIGPKLTKEMKETGATSTEAVPSSSGAQPVIAESVEMPQYGEGDKFMDPPASLETGVGDTPWNDPANMQPDIAKESLESMDSMTKVISEPVLENNPPDNTPQTFEPEVKKEQDGANPWPKPNYPPNPMDPYGNYYPGYPGYYGPPPGYDPYRGYPPVPPVKAEPSGEGTPPPNPPPMYPAYHPPYPYPYNYPPYPPQGQPGASTVKTEGSEPSAFVPPPYGPRPPYPPAPNPGQGYYPNYPPHPPYPPRPYHDPNYPYPNYNPYMPPGAYGYPPYVKPTGGEGAPQTDGAPAPQ